MQSGIFAQFRASLGRFDIIGLRTIKFYSLAHAYLSHWYPHRWNPQNCSPRNQFSPHTFDHPLVHRSPGETDRRYTWVPCPESRYSPGPQVPLRSSVRPRQSPSYRSQHSKPEFTKTWLKICDFMFCLHTEYCSKKCIIRLHSYGIFNIKKKKKKTLQFYFHVNGIESTITIGKNSWPYSHKIQTTIESDCRWSEVDSNENLVKRN